MTPGPARGRLVEVAVDAPAGPGPRTYTYLVPAGLEDLETGEAVLVPFGKGGRQAIGIVIGEGTAPRAGELRPLAARIRSDGPLLPPLALAFAALIADRYLAPLAVVIRAMLPPGMLERLELMAEVTPGGEARMGRPDPACRCRTWTSSTSSPGGPGRCATCPAPRVGPRCCAGSGRWPTRTWSTSTWTLLGAALGPRYERRLWVTDDGRSAASALAAASVSRAARWVRASGTRSPSWPRRRRRTRQASRPRRSWSGSVVVHRGARASRPRPGGGP